MTATKDQFFKPGRASAQDKASATETAARQIIATEAAQRERKTAHLRELREAREAEAGPAAPPSRKKPASRGKA